MEHQDSLSKGFFFYKPSTGSSKTSKKSKIQFPDPLSLFQSTTWHSGYREVWNQVEDKLRTIGDEVMKVLLNDIVAFVQGAPSGSNLIPTVLLLTGVNLPDHCSLFNHLKSKLEEAAASHVAMLSSCDCSNIKQTVEQVVSQFVARTGSKSMTKYEKSKNSLRSRFKDSSSESGSDDLMSQDEELGNCKFEKMEVDDNGDSETIKKSDCTMPFLANWYERKLNSSSSLKDRKLVIIFKDFEGFQQNILHNLILILSGYHDKLPIVLMFGVATTEAAIGESLTHQITSKLALKVFQSQPSVFFLNNTIDKVFLTPDCPFQLSGKLLKFFTDVFLFYDFSVNQFTKGIKYCVMDHFFQNDLVGLFCQDEKTVRNKLKTINKAHLKDLVSFPSVKKYCEERLNNGYDKEENDLTKPEIMFIISTLRRKITEFYLYLRILHTLVKDLPQAPLGKQLRELYCTAMCKDISKTTGYKECHQYLNFTSKDELEEKISSVLTILSSDDSPHLKEVKNTINNFKLELEQIGLKPNTRSPVKSPMKIDLNVKNRSQLKQRLAEISIQSKVKVGFEALRENIINYFMESLLPEGLAPYTERTHLWELVIVSDIDARNRVVPRIRAPIHTALNNPHHYLQCKCCEITDENSILSTMPDICIAYKLHLEGGPLINVYDWLQSFSMIVESTDEKKCIEDGDERVQARFTQALAELEFLGFIKSSKSKPDHVSRLTWGGSST